MSGVEKFLFSLGLKSSWLKSPGLKGLGLKLGVEKSGVEMSFNRQQSGRVLSYLPGQNSNDLCSEYFSLCQFSSFIFCIK